MGIDYDLWLRLSAYYQFDFIAEPTVRYRIWAGQMSKNYRKRYESGSASCSAFSSATQAWWGLGRTLRMGTHLHRARQQYPVA